MKALGSPVPDRVNAELLTHDPEALLRGQDVEIRPALNRNSEVGRKERKELKEGKGLGEPSRWTISRADLSTPVRSYCVLCVLCGYSISEFGLNAQARPRFANGEAG